MQTSSAQTVIKDIKGSEIVSVILEDHKPLKQFIKIMKNSDKSDEERITAFEEFAPALVAHAKPEEEILYFFMKRDENLKEDGCEGEVEHMIADQLVEEIKRTKDRDMKLARIKVLTELVEHHIEEEEEDLLPKFKKETNVQTRVRMASQFLELKLKYFH